MTKSLHKVIFFLTFLILANGLEAQVRFTISGVITDAKTGEILPGATVFEKGTSTGTSASETGYYSLPLPKGKYRIVFSFVGYENTEEDIHFDILPHDIFRFGIEPQSDWCNFLCRALLFKDSAAQQRYMNNIPVEIMRVKAKPNTQLLFFSVPPFLPRANGTMEFSLLPGMYILEDEIYDACNENYEIILLDSYAWITGLEESRIS